MSQTLATQAIMAAIQLAVDEHEAYPLEVDGTNFCTVDKNLQADPYLKVEINFLQAEQMDLGTNPFVKQWGQIEVIAKDKEGNGWPGATALLDHVRPYLELRKLGIVTCLSAGALKARKVDGEWCVPMIVNFYYHRQT